MWAKKRVKLGPPLMRRGRDYVATMSLRFASGCHTRSSRLLNRINVAGIILVVNLTISKNSVYIAKRNNI